MPDASLTRLLVGRGSAPRGGDTSGIDMSGDLSRMGKRTRPLRELEPGKYEHPDNPFGYLVKSPFGYTDPSDGPLAGNVYDENGNIIGIQ